MAGEFRLADVGEGLTEAEIVRWLVGVGDRVAVDQPLVEVETAKSIIELPSPFAGTVLRLGAQVGETLPVGAVIAVIGDAGESSPRAGNGDAPIVGTLREEAETLLPAAAAPVGPGRRVRALPPVRKLARSLGVDLATVTGTGPDGTITRDDVVAAQGSAQPGERPRPDDRLGEQRRPGGQRRPQSKLRRTIAANLTNAWSTIPMVTSFDEVDATRLLSARAALAAHHERPMPLDALLVAAVLPVLRAFPEFNSSLDGDTLVVHDRHDIGIAVDTPDGLMVAVIADAGSMSLLGLAGEVARLGAGARARTLTTAELTGQTFTVSNIGAVGGGGGHGTPLVPQGTVAILSAGRAAPKPVARDGQVAVAPVLPLSLSYDHRVIDGAMGRRFLALLTEFLREPALLLG